MAKISISNVKALFQTGDRPTQENYIAPIDKVQLLSEAKSTASTLFEGVIADCANLSGKSQNVFKKEIFFQKKREKYTITNSLFR